MRVRLRDIAVAATTDPKQALLDAVGDLSGVDVFHNLVLVATYIEPEKTAGGIIKPDRTLMESRFQGKCALVLKKGPMAFVDEGYIKFGGKTVEAGDWVIVNPSDGFEMFKGAAGSSDGGSVRLFEDAKIKGRIDDPATVY